MFREFVHSRNNYLVCVLPVNLSWMITVHLESVFSVSDIELEKAAQMFIWTHYRMS
ncbi:protein of unknown function [Lactiplantibacillus plantarum]